MFPLAPYPDRSIVRTLVPLFLLAITGVAALYYSPDKLWVWAIASLTWLLWLSDNHTKSKHEPLQPSGPSTEDSLTLALHLQGAGRLDSAYTVFRSFVDHPKGIAMLYNLARDYEVIRNYQKSTEIYSLIALRDAGYRDVQERLRNASTKRPVTSESVQIDSSAYTNEDSLFNHRYAINKQLGTGANSKVYLARDQKHKNQLVALKVMTLEPENGNRQQHAELLSRFIQESSTAAKLNHPNIVKVIDSNQLDHVAYISMEYVAGASLKQHANSHRLLTQPTVVRLMIQCANALSYAHGKGIIHRDVKPANILYDATLNVAKLTDFGIARVSNSTATVAGSFLGTPSYMSPEQIAGYSLDARSDIYSLGATLFRLLTGHSPYQAATIGELMQAVSTQPHRDILSFNPDLHPSLKNIIDKALAKNPADRYQHIDELTIDLNHCLLNLVGDGDEQQ